MTVSMSTSSMTIYPESREGKNGQNYHSTQVSAPVTHRVSFSPDGGNNPKQMQAAFELAADNGQFLDIIYSSKSGYQGAIDFVIYDLKPKTSTPKPNN